MKELSNWLWSLAAALFVASGVIGGRRWGEDLASAVVVILVNVLVVVPLAALATVVAKRRRIGERLGILPPGAGLADDEDEDDDY